MNKQRGFTLIEILIAVALIAVLGTSVIVLVDPVGQFQKGRDAERKSELSQIQTALELYRADMGAYPAVLPACDAVFSQGTVTYLRKTPCDPKNTGAYVYTYRQLSASSYSITTCLENVRDPKKDAANVAPCAGGTTNWSYTVFNP